MTKRIEGNVEDRGPSVLLIDDDRLFVRPMAEDMIDQGIQVTTATTVEEALDLVNGHQIFDAVFTDLMMPASHDFESRFGPTDGGFRTGFRLAEHVRKTHPELPIIAYTVSDLSDLREPNSPFDHVISKSSYQGELPAWREIQERYLARKLNKSRDWVKDSLSEENLVLFQAKPSLFMEKQKDFKSRRQQIVVSVNENILKVLDGEIERLPDISPRDFEEVCAVALGRLGYDVTITPQGPDDGIDLIAIPKDEIIRSAFIVQCKRYRHDLKVETPELKQLKCVVDDYRANGGIMMTSSFFTSGAENYALENQYRLQLFDVLRLKSLLEDGAK